MMKSRDSFNNKMKDTFWDPKELGFVKRNNKVSVIKYKPGGGSPGGKPNNNKFFLKIYGDPL